MDISPSSGGTVAHASGRLDRTAFSTDRALEFFTESELTTQIGYHKRLWPLVLVKELIDNALDACETTAIAPEIGVTLEPDALIVEDNGPGLPAAVLERSLDYHVRISDKKHYVAPTRGQLGNALKCVWAAPFVANGTHHGLVEVIAQARHHRIEVSLDRIAQKPVLEHTATEASVKNGTSVKIHWSGIACCPIVRPLDFYRPSAPMAEVLTELIASYAAFNPHATFRFGDHKFTATDPEWQKWRTDQPTSPHWYRPGDLRNLIAAYVAENDRPVRDFVAEFAGLSGTQVRKRVLAEAGISATRLSDLIVNGDIDITAVESLLAAMQNNSKPVDPKRLGVIGKEHLEQAITVAGADSSFRYWKKAEIDDEGLPLVIEIAFGIAQEGAPRCLILGLNNAPVFKLPSGAIANALTDCRVQPSDPVVLLIHMARPQFPFTDHGKGALADE